MKKILTISLLLLCTAVLFAQGNKTFSGKVTDTAGEPLIGATVSVKGTTNGVITDFDGNYKIANVPAAATLVFSYVGYDEATIVLTGSEEATLKDVKLAESHQDLDEVVVVGYGTQKVSTLSGAVGVVDGKMLNARPVVSTAQALQGADPATTITFSTGSPNASANIDIRGSLSLNGGSPLVLADGVEVELNQINPNDIESVSILKDASTCAIYGAKASAGVVLITTKNGKQGKTNIKYSGRFGIQSNTTSTDFITNGYEYAQIANLFQQNSPSSIKNTIDYTGSIDDPTSSMYQLYIRRNDETEDPSRPWVTTDAEGNWLYYGNFDWYGYLYKRQRPQHEHNVSVTGGTDKVKYYVSGRYYGQDGIMNGNAADYFNSFAFRSKLDVKLFDWLKYSNNIAYTNTKYTWQGVEDINKFIQLSRSQLSPTFVPYNSDGTIVDLPIQNLMTTASGGQLAEGNAAYIAYGKAHHAKTNDYLNMTNRLDFIINKHLDFTVAYDLRSRNRLTTHRNTGYNRSMKQGVTEYYTDSKYRNSYEEDHYILRSHVINAYGTYDNTWNDHSFKATFGMQYETCRDQETFAYKRGLITEDLDAFSLGGNEQYITLDEDIEAYKTLGYFIRLNYDWKGRYIVEASARYDGTSRFQENHRWGFFPSMSLGWTISEEPFFESLKKAVPFLKLRASAGSLGNQQVSAYSYIQTISTNNSQTYTFDGNSLSYYSKMSAPVSGDYTWETINTYDAGLDIRFLDSRLSVVADYYIRDTKDMLTSSIQLPEVYGTTNPKSNCADLRTNGFEVVVKWMDSFELGGKTFSYNVSGSLGDNVTKITKYYNPDRLLSSYYEGQTLGDIWGYHVYGLFASDEEAAAYQKYVNSELINAPIFNNSPACGNYLRAGDVWVADLNGNGKIDNGAGTVDDPGDKVLIGNTSPRYKYSFSGGFNWNGIDFSVMFQGIGKKNWYPIADYVSDFWVCYGWSASSFIPKGYMDNVWSEDNTDAYFPRPRGYYARTGSSTKGAIGFKNDYYLQNIGYLRLKNLTLGYTLPSRLTKKILMEAVRFYASGENLWYWSPLKKYCKTIDPELASGSGLYSSNSGTGYSYPRTVSVGVDITF